MPRVGFEPTVSAGERPKTYALDRAATGTGTIYIDEDNYKSRPISTAASAMYTYLYSSPTVLFNFLYNKTNQMH